MASFDWLPGLIIQRKRVNWVVLAEDARFLRYIMVTSKNLAFLSSDRLEMTVENKKKAYRKSDI